MKKDLQEKIARFLEDLSERRDECEEGHKEVVWFPYAVSSRSLYRDGVKGMCKYCLTDLTRHLNNSEMRNIESFRKSLYIPTTI